MDFEPSDTLVRAARELLRWDQRMLADQAKVGLATVRRFETGASIQQEKIDAIVGALQAAGVAFLGPKTRRSEITQGVALTSASEPLDRPAKRVYTPRGTRAPRATRRKTRPTVA